MKKHILMAVLVGCAVVAAGCGNSQKKETEALKTAETAAARETEAAKAETEAAAVAAETEAAEVTAETEAAEVTAETEAAAVAAETEAAEVTAETEAAEETEAKEDTAVETETEEAETAAPASETELEAAETESDLSLGSETEIFGSETESDFPFGNETESELFDLAETETEFEIRPRPEYDVTDYLQIDDEDYKGIAIQVTPAAVVTDEEVNEEIENAFYFLEDYDDLVKKIKTGKVKEGDLLNIDYVGTKDGEEFDGGSAEGYDLEIGSGSFIDGFEEGLIGKEIGSEVDLNLTFPEDYGVDELNGADVVFHVTINYASEMPEITDEIAKKLSGGEYDNAKDYIQSVRDDIQAGYDEEYRMGAYSQIMEKLFELYPVEEYPEENIEYLIDNLMAQYIVPYASMYGMSVEDFIANAYNGLTEEEFREQQMEPSAMQSLEQEIILNAIGEKEGISVTDEDMEELFQEYADDYGVSVEEIKEEAAEEDHEEALRSYRMQEKVMEWLFENAEIEEVEETETSVLTGNETEAETEISSWNETESEA